MKPISSRRLVDAPVEAVFQVVSDIRNYSKINPDIIEIEFLSDQQTGVGTKFRETRRMGSKTASTELEVTELEENKHVRIVSDAGGTIWDSVFSVKETDGKTELMLDMEIKPYKFFARLFIPMIRKMVVKGIEKDMDCIKESFEKGSSVESDN